MFLFGNVESILFKSETKRILYMLHILLIYKNMHRLFKNMTTDSYNQTTWLTLLLVSSIQ
jgi:hypothetical protein